MAGTLPTTPKFQTLNIRSNNNTLTTRSMSGRVQAKSLFTQYWSFTASYPVGTRADFGELMAFIVKQKGQYETFTAILPDYSNTQGALTTETLAIDNVGGYSQGNNTLAVDATTNSVPGALKAGDFVNFTNHNKVYMVTEDVDIDISGNGTLKIEPSLIIDVPDGQTIQYNAVQFTCRLSGDAQEFTTGVAGTVKYELDIIEDL